MAISETTKIAVAGRKAELRQRFKKNKADIKTHQDAVATLVAQNQVLKATADALEADIPAPTPAPEPV